MRSKYFPDLLEMVGSYDASSQMIEVEYAFLLGKMETFARYVDLQEYSISRKDIAALLGFELTEKKEK